MSMRRSMVAWSAYGMLLLAACTQGMAADESAGLMAHIDVEQMAPRVSGAIIPPMLRVKPRAVENSRYVEKPWKSYVCVGCELNTRLSPDE